MIGTLDIECQAKNPNLPLAPMTAFVNSPSSLRIRNVPKRIGDWCIRNVYVTCVYPDGSTQSVQCVLVGGVYVGTIQGTSTSGTSKNGYTIFADGTDENGNAITGYVLGKGDINILEADGQLNPNAKLYYVHLLSSEGQTHTEGDLWQVSGTYYIWQDGQAWPIGDDSGVIDELSTKVDNKADLSALDEYVTTDDFDEAISAKADVSVIPTKTSDLSNDSGFITSAEIEPYHDVLTPNVNTGVAKQAMSIALSDNSNHLKPNSALAATVKTNRDLTDEFTVAMQYATYYPYYLEKYFEQTFSPALELKFCNDKIAYMAGSRPRTIYTGYMFRTSGAGFAMPCSEDGIPDGRLYETTDVTTVAAIIADQTTSLHQLTFTSRYDDPYGQVATVDGQNEQMTCWRTNAFKSYTILEKLANKSELPTKTSELSNDSGFITSADISSKADLSSLDEKQDILADEQLFAIDSAMNASKTKVVYNGALTQYFCLSGIVTSADFLAISSITDVQLGDGVTGLQKKTFSGCSALTSITFPEGFTEIGGNALENTGLSSVKLPESLSVIGEYSFYKTKLSSIEIPANVKDIQSGTFSQCSSLMDLKFHEGLNHIDSYAFRDCRALTKVEIPRSVENIDYGAFLFCQNISSMIFKDRTMDEVSAMAEYPWGIAPAERLSVFGTAHDATQEWVSSFAVKNDGGVSKIQRLTQSQYDAISATADLSTLYVITEN